jgi:hypothetical protein
MSISAASPDRTFPSTGRLPSGNLGAAGRLGVSAGSVTVGPTTQELIEI